MALTQKQVRVKRTGINVEVWQKGQGSDLVFLHGAGGQAAWTPDLDALSKRYRVTVPIHPGFGKSEGGESINDPLDLVLHTFDLLGQLGIERPHLVGHSMGGMLAAEMGAVCPNDVASLVLVCPVGLWDDDHPVLDFFALRPVDLLPYIFHDTRHPMAQALSVEVTDEELLVEMLVAYTRSLSAAGRLMWPIPDRGLKKRITRIAAPTRIIWGESDGLVPRFYAQAFRKSIRGSKVDIVRKASHMVLVEQPERCVSIILGFLAEVEATQSTVRKKKSKPARPSVKKNAKKKTASKAKPKRPVRPKSQKRGPASRKNPSAKKPASKEKKRTASKVRR